MFWRPLRHTRRMKLPLPNDPIPFITLPNWVKAASQCGFNIEPVFERLGIDTDLIHLEEATVTVPKMEQLMEACVALSPQQHFPFVLGEAFAFDYLPDIGTFLATSPTLREAARVFDWVRELINPYIDVQLLEQGDAASLVLVGERDAAAAQDRYFVESVFASIVRFGRMLSGDVEQFTQLRFRHPPPAYAAIYAAHFRVPVRFSQQQNALDIPRSFLDRPLGGAYRHLHDQAAQRVGQRLARQPRRGGLVADAEAALEREPQLLRLGIDALARSLALHPRTLQRRLREEGESFGDLLARVRYRLAQQALQDSGRDIESISEQLGFSDRRSFTRAFTRWAGMSPSQFRTRGS